MIFTATRYRRVPRFYVRRVMRRVLTVAAQNPGFHRFVIDLPALGSTGTGFMVNPDAEPEIRRLLGRIMVLSPQTDDPEPWGHL